MSLTLEMAQTFVGKKVVKISYNEDKNDRTLTLEFDDASYVKLDYIDEPSTGYESLKATAKVALAGHLETVFDKRVEDDPQ